MPFSVFQDILEDKGSDLTIHSHLSKNLLNQQHVRLL